MFTTMFHEMSWGWVFMMTMMLLFWGGIAALVYWLVPAPGERATATATSTALAVLDERYARGDIDETEWRHRRAALDGKE